MEKIGVKQHVIKQFAADKYSIHVKLASEPYTGVFVKWANKKRLEAVFACSDGEQRKIPVVAVCGFKPEEYP